MKKFRSAIIGCGTIFPMHAQSLINVKNASLVAVCDIDKRRGLAASHDYKCRCYNNFRNMLEVEPLDVVHVCTPHYLHKQMVIEAARHKVHILTEKPMGLDPKEAKQEIAAAHKNKVSLGVIFQNRFNPGSRLVKRRIDDGSLGKLKGAKLVLTYHKPDSFYKKSPWKGKKATEGGGVVIDQAIHYLDILRWLVPSPVDYVEAHCQNRCHGYIDVEDLAEGVIVFKNGFYACFYLINYYSFDDDPFIDIDCEKGRVHIVKDSAAIDYYSGKRERADPQKGEYIDYGGGVKSYWGYCHYNQIKDYYEALANRRKPAITGDDALKTQELVWAIYESSLRGKKVRI